MQFFTIITAGLTFLFSFSMLLIQPNVVIEHPIEEITPVEIIIVETLPAIATTTPEIHEHEDVGHCLEYEDLINSYDWPTTTAMQICGDESGGKHDAVGDVDTDYVSCGLMQIRTLPGRPTCHKLKDPEFNMEFAYLLWKEEGFEPWATFLDIDKECSSCIEFVRRYIPELPRAETPADYKPNSIPCVGCAVLMEYSDGTHHIAYTTEILETGISFIDCNREEPYKIGDGFISWDSTALRGFWQVLNVPKGTVDNTP